MKLRFVVTRPCELAGRPLCEGDVVVLDDERMDTLVAAALPYNAGAVLGLFVTDALRPCDVTPEQAREALDPPRPAPRVLPFPIGRRARYLKG